MEYVLIVFSSLTTANKIKSELEKKYSIKSRVIQTPKNIPVKTNKAITPSFTATIIPAILAESLVPLTKIAVVIAIMIIAGRFMQKGIPAI